MDLEKFRLRRFAERLVELGEVEQHEEPVALADLAAIIESTPKATWFKNVGRERFEIIASVAGSRGRLAAALGVDPSDAALEVMRRMNAPQPVVEVSSAEAPVHAVVRTGTEIDLMNLPFHFQHEYDGGPYISSGIDYSVDPITGMTNAGCRRLMFRDRTTMRANLQQASDLMKSYRGCVERGERLPVSYVLASHPIDLLAAAGIRHPIDEFALVGTLRGEPVPMVRGLTNGVLAPADAEIIVEGYFDELGYREKEGPYAEYYGFYGGVYVDPVFHVTAITMRADVLYQSVRHAAKLLSWNESSQLSSINSEGGMWRTLRAAGIEPSAIHGLAAANGQHVRVALRRGVPGQARLAIAALFAHRWVKQITVVDDDIDVFSDEEVEWAMAARFRPEGDIVTSDGHPGFAMDPQTDGAGHIAKVAYDCTARYGVPDTVETRRPRPPHIERARRFGSVREALAAGPRTFMTLMAELGSDDGRELMLELSELRDQGKLEQLPDGEWSLAGQS